MQNLSIADIRALAVESRKENRFIPLGTDEMNRKRELIMKYWDEQDDDENEFAAIRAEFNARKKDRNDVLKSLRAQLRRRDEERETLVYDVPMHDLGMMHTYDETAQLLGSRRLTAAERQTTIHELTQTKAA
jgi:hypothetical protein